MGEKLLDNRKFIFDDLCELRYNAIDTIIYPATSLSGQRWGRDSDGDTQYFDTGGGYTEGMFVVDITQAFGKGTRYRYSTAGAAAAGASLIRICLEGGKDTAFASLCKLAEMEFGDSGEIAADEDKLSTGRYFVPFVNDFGGVLYRYLRCYHYQYGSCASGIGYRAFISVRGR